MCGKKKNAYVLDDKRKTIVKKTAAILLGTAIASFGMYNIHQVTHITEGGVLGMILLLNYWFGLPSSILSPILDVLCYIFAYKQLGKDFIRWSIVATLSLAGFFRLWEQFPRMLPDLSAYPLAAAVLGGLFIGIGVGLVVRQGSSSGGDDALALAISKMTGWRIARCYMITDFTVLFLSLSYIPVRRIVFSLITVTISSWVIEWVQNAGSHREKIGEPLTEA